MGDCVFHSGRNVFSIVEGIIDDDVVSLPSLIIVSNSTYFRCLQLQIEVEASQEEESCWLQDM